jgi:periplasmic divalent cation tolerance protein
MTDKIVVLSTAGSQEEAHRLATHFIEKRVAACVNILPGVRSIYRWKGAVEDGLEFMLIIKTRRSLLPALEQELRSAHSYEIPEMIALPVVEGLQEYLNWIDQETSEF